jgi:hypothetical protein
VVEWDKKYTEERGDPVGLLLSFGYKELERYGQDRFFSTREYGPFEPKSKIVRKFKTRESALAAIRKVPPNVELDLKRMTWRHKNSAKTHFVVVGD